MAQQDEFLSQLPQDTIDLFNEKLKDADLSVKGMGFEGQAEGTKLKVTGISGDAVEIETVPVDSPDFSIEQFSGQQTQPQEQQAPASQLESDTVELDGTSYQFDNTATTLSPMTQAAQQQYDFDTATIGIQEQASQTETEQSQTTEETASEKADALTQKFSELYEQNFAEQQNNMVAAANNNNPPQFEQFNEQYRENITNLENAEGYDALKAEFDQLTPEEQEQVINGVKENAQQNYVAALEEKGVDTEELKNQIEEYNKKEQSLLSQIDPDQLSEIFGEEFGTIITLFMGLVEAFSGQEEEPTKEQVNEEVDAKVEAIRNDGKEEEQEQQYEMGEDGTLYPDKPFSEMSDKEIADFQRAQAEVYQQQEALAQAEEAAKQKPAKQVSAMDGITGITDNEALNNTEKPQEEVTQESNPYASLAGMENFSINTDIKLSGADIAYDQTFAPETTAVDFDALKEQQQSAGRA